ncbi:hypothetical protein [Dyella sp. ASV21]|uniref:hypothetical protein n=1 Tax=Dyella sp. ASV21 TaxID=2795114 RepID=UPI0018EB41BC|nr:hypothetical protein [Dyella sp. ASV21]
MRFKNKHAYGPTRDGTYTLDQCVIEQVNNEQRDDTIRELSAKLDMLTQIVGSMTEVLTTEQKTLLAQRWGYEVVP